MKYEYSSKKDGSLSLEFLRPQMKSFVRANLEGGSESDAVFSLLVQVYSMYLSSRLAVLRSQSKLRRISPLLETLSNFEPISQGLMNEIMTFPDLSRDGRSLVLAASLVARYKVSNTSESRMLLDTSISDSFMPMFRVLPGEDPLGSDALSRALFYACILKTEGYLKEVNPYRHSVVRNKADLLALESRNALYSTFSVPELGFANFTQHLFWVARVFALSSELQKLGHVPAQYGRFLCLASDFLVKQQGFSLEYRETSLVVPMSDDEITELRNFGLLFWEFDVQSWFSDLPNS